METVLQLILAAQDPAIFSCAVLIAKLYLHVSKDNLLCIQN